MRDLINFDRTACEESEADIRAMCDKLKLVAPPVDYSLEDAIEKVTNLRAVYGQDLEEVGLIPAFRDWLAEIGGMLSSAITMRRLSNLASSIIVILMLMIIPLALFSNRSMAMNSDVASTRHEAMSDEALRVECAKKICGDTKYEK